MSASLRRQFVDSSVLVYAYDRTQEAKWERARTFLESLWASREATLSVQVLQEFFRVVTRKLPQPLSSREARTIVADLSKWPYHRPGAADVLAAIDLQDELKVSFWDAMIIQSARRMSCSVLCTEDLNDGQSYVGVLVRDPFKDLVMENEDDAYARAREHALEVLKHPFNLGTFGKITWARDELHERHPQRKAK
jgi:predicted nucleic acid-binding protein